VPASSRKARGISAVVRAARAPPETGLSTGDIKPDHTITVDTVFKTILTEVTDEDVPYEDMCPSVFSSMRITMEEIGPKVVERVDQLTLSRPIARAHCTHARAGAGAANR
jgi:hypothetical protein